MSDDATTQDATIDAADQGSPAGDDTTAPGATAGLGGLSAVADARARRLAARSGPATRYYTPDRTRRWQPHRAAAASAPPESPPAPPPAPPVRPAKAAADASVFAAMVQDAAPAAAPLPDRGPVVHSILEDVPATPPAAPEAPSQLEILSAAPEAPPAQGPMVFDLPAAPEADAVVAAAPEAAAAEEPEAVAEAEAVTPPEPEPELESVAPEPEPEMAAPEPELEPVAAEPAAPAPEPATRVIAELGPGMRLRLRQIGYGTPEALAAADPAALREALGEISRLLNVEAWIADAQRELAERDAA